MWARGMSLVIIAVALGMARFVPPLNEAASSVGIKDVHLVENGIIYLTGRSKGGPYILELTI